MPRHTDFDAYRDDATLPCVPTGAGVSGKAAETEAAKSNLPVATCPEGQERKRRRQRQLRVNRCQGVRKVTTESELN